MPNQQTAKRYITGAQLRERWGDVSHMFLERRLKGDPAFPRPIKLGDSPLRLWDLEKIEAYERACVAARPLSAPPPTASVTKSAPPPPPATPRRRRPLRRIRLNRDARDAR